MQNETPKYSGISYVKCSILLTIILIPMIFWPQITGLVDGDILFPGKTLGNKYVNLTRSDFEKKYQKGLEHIREENLNKALSLGGFYLEVQENYKCKKPIIIYNYFTANLDNKIINNSNKIKLNQNSVK